MRFPKYADWVIGAPYNIAIAVLCLATLGACAHTRHVHWTEDVRLSDGRTMVVRRTEEYRRVTDPGAGFRTGWLFKRASIATVAPAPISPKASWEGSVSPLVLDIQPDGITYLVCDLATGSARIEWKVPRHEFYVVFRLVDSTWNRISLSELPLPVQPNLVPNGELLAERGIRSGTHVDLNSKLKDKLSSALPPSVD